MLTSPPSTFDVDCKYKECLVILADTLTYHIFSYLCISQKEWWYSSQNLLRKVFFVFLASSDNNGFSGVFSDVEEEGSREDVYRC